MSFVKFLDLGFCVHFVLWFGLIDGWFNDLGLGLFGRGGKMGMRQKTDEKVTLQ